MVAVARRRWDHSREHTQLLYVTMATTEATVMETHLENDKGADFTGSYLSFLSNTSLHQTDRSITGIMI